MRNLVYTKHTSNLDELKDWCYANVCNHWSYGTTLSGFNSFWFMDEVDALAFRLRFGL